MENMQAGNNDGVLAHIGMEMLQWHKLPSTGVNYLCFIDWMKYNSRWIPSRIHFMSTSSSGNYTVIPELNDLKCFTLDDTLENDKLPYSPIDVMENCNLDTNSHFKVPVNEINNFLKTTLHKKLSADDGWNLTIATIDKSAYHFLVSYMPADIVPVDIVYMGPNWKDAHVETEFVMRRKEKRESQKLEMELLQWDQLPQNVTWLAFVDFMRYNKRWMPCKIRFMDATFNETRDHVNVIPDSKDLKHFTYEDLKKNKTLDKYPPKLMKAVQESKNKHQVPVNEMNSFLQKIVDEKQLQMDGKINIATIDKATYNFLELLLPSVNMVYFGSKCDDEYQVLQEYRRRFGRHRTLDELDQIPAQ